MRGCAGTHKGKSGALLMTPICIAGMHRSGTSVIAQLLHRCGIQLGDESMLMAATPDSPNSLWEDTRFVVINDAILGAFGGAWDYPPAMDHGWPEDERLDTVRRDAEALLAECANQGTPWGWKDPRNSLTFPFWQRYFPDMKVVFSLRDPLAVARSLHARSHHSYVFGLTMWYRYAAAFCDAVPPGQRIVTAYDAYGDDASAELARVLAFLDVTVPIAARDQALASVSSEMHQHPYTEQELHEAGVGAAIIDLYARLREEAGLRAGRVEPREGITDGAKPAPQPAPPPLEGVGQIDYRAIETAQLRFEIEDVRVRFASLEAAYRTLEHEHHDLEHQLRNVRAEYRDLATYCRKLEQELADRDDARQETDTYIRALAAQLSAFNDEQTRTGSYVQHLTEQLTASEGEHGRVADYVRTLEEQLAALKDEQARTSGYVRLLEKEQVHDVADEQARVSGYVRTLEQQIVATEGEQERTGDYVRTLEEQLAAAKSEQEQATGYLQMLERQIFTAHRARQEAEIRLISLEQQIAQHRGTSHPGLRP